VHTRRTSGVTRHASHVTLHTSHITHHASQVQDCKPDLSSWLQSNILSSLTEDGFAQVPLMLAKQNPKPLMFDQATVCIPNVSHIPVFVSLALAQHASPATLSRLLLLLQRLAPDPPPPAPPPVPPPPPPLKSTRRRPSASDQGWGGGSALSDDQAYLKAYAPPAFHPCVCVTL